MDVDVEEDKVERKIVALNSFYQGQEERLAERVVGNLY
jgi:hypothetical protein